MGVRWQIGQLRSKVGVGSRSELGPMSGGDRGTAVRVFAASGLDFRVAGAIMHRLPHACCMRKPMHDGSRNPEVQTAGGEHSNCCPPVTTAHWAELGSGTDSNLRPQLAYLPPDSHPILRSNYENDLRPVRGPPLT